MTTLRRRATKAIENLEEQALEMSQNASKSGLKWSEIDKVRFYSIGTGMYSALTVVLHPITVIKIRQQVTNSGPKGVEAAMQHQPTLGAVIRGTMNSSAESGLDKIRPLYRGLGVILTLAVPARALYIGVLEGSREGVGDTMNSLVMQAVAGPEEAHAMLPLVATISSGIAGGLAALAAQTLVVPMDVISQKQMVMDPKTSASEGSAMSVVQSVLRKDGWRGLFRGFGLSMVSSLPTGSMWWATYGGCQAKLQPYSDLRLDEGRGSLTHLSRRAIVQLISGISAAMVASVLTQPLDVMKTRLQVGVENSSKQQGNNGAAARLLSYGSISRDLLATSGVRGFFRGTGPRIMHMGLWGTVLSSAYEYLRHVSRKDRH